MARRAAADYNGGAGVGGTYTLPGGAALADNFHLYAVEWTTNQIKWFLDNTPYFIATPTSLPSGATWVFTAAAIHHTQCRRGRELARKPRQHDGFSPANAGGLRPGL